VDDAVDPGRRLDRDVLGPRGRLLRTDMVEIDEQV